MSTEETQLRLLKVLADDPRATQRQLSHRLGVSLGKANYCLRALIERGWVKAQRFGASPHKLRYAYVLTPAGVSARARLSARFLRRKLAEYEALQREIEALRQEAAAQPTDDHHPDQPASGP